MANKFLDSTGVKHLWGKIKDTYQPKGDYVTTNVVKISLVADSGTLSSTNLDTLKARPQHVVFERSGFYYFAENLSGGSTWYYSCNVYYSGNQIIKRVISINTSNGSFSKTDYTYSPSDTNTWRDVVDSLTSTSKDKSLSANQGKILNDKIAAIIDGSQYVQNAVDADSAAYATEAGDSAQLGGVVASSYVTLTGSQALTNKTYNGYTLAAACAKGVTDSTSANAISTGTNLVTERDVYYGLASINGARQTSSVGIYAPTSVGSNGYILTATGTGAPTWVSPKNTIVGTADYAVKADQDGLGNYITSTYLPKSGGSFYDSVDVTWTKYNRKMIINGNNITFDPTADTGTYAGSLLDVKHAKGTTTAIGVYGNYSEGLTHIFMGGSYDAPAMKMDASGNFTFKNLVTLTYDKAQLQFRGGHASYDSVISYQTSGNEAMVFSTKNAVTSFMFVNGEDTVTNISSARWKNLTPGLQIKNNKVSIGKLIADGATPVYNLDVGGTANATTIYENGTALSDKYQAKGSGGSGMATVAYNVGLTDGDSIDLKPYINEGYKVFKGFIQTDDQVDETITINVNGSRFTFNDNYLNHHIEIIRISDYNGGNHSIMIQGSDGNSMDWSQASGSGFYITYSLSNGGSVSASITLYAFK